MPLEQRSRQVTLVSNVLPRGSPESEKLALCYKTSPRGPKRNTAVLSNRLDNVKWTMNLKHIFFTCAGSFSVFFLPMPSGLLYFKEYHQLERVDFTKKNSCPGSRSNKEDQGEEFVVYIQKNMFSLAQILHWSTFSVVATSKCWTTLFLFENL